MTKLKTGKRYLIGAGIFLLAACTVRTSDQPTAPPVVNNIITPNDSGPLVGMLCIGFGLLIAVGIGVWLFRDRRDAQRRVEERRAEETDRLLRGAVYLNGEYYRPALNPGPRRLVQADLPMLERGQY
jgi:hypothetical protein